MIDKPSNGFDLIKDTIIEANIFEHTYNREVAKLDDRVLLSQNRVEKML